MSSPSFGADNERPLPSDVKELLFELPLEHREHIQAQIMEMRTTYNQRCQEMLDFARQLPDEMQQAIERYVASSREANELDDIHEFISDPVYGQQVLDILNRIDTAGQIYTSGVNECLVRPLKRAMKIRAARES